MRVLFLSLTMAACACADARAPATAVSPSSETPRDTAAGPDRRERPRGPSALAPFAWPPYAERYEAELREDEALVLGMIPQTGLVMLGHLDGAQRRYVAFDPVGAIFYVFDAGGSVVRTRTVDIDSQERRGFSGGTRGGDVHLSVFDDDFFARVRWDVATDVVTPIRIEDDEASDVFENIELCVFGESLEAPDCAEGAFPEGATRPSFGGFLRPTEAFSHEGDVFAITEEGLVEIHGGHADFTRCRQRPAQVVSDAFGVRSIDYAGVCDAERGVLARGSIAAVSMNGRFVLLRYGEQLHDAAPPARYVLHDAARGPRDLGGLAIPDDVAYFGVADPAAYRPFLDEGGRHLVLAPSGILIDDSPIVVIDLATGHRTTQSTADDAADDDSPDCLRAPVQVGDDLFTGGCGRPIFKVSLVTGAITTVATRPPGHFAPPARLLGRAAANTLRTEGLTLVHGESALRLVRLPYYGEDRIAIIEQRGAHFVVDAILDTARFARHTGATTPLRPR